MKDLEKAKLILKKGGLTCVLCREDTVYSSDKTGISPMLDFIDGNIPLNDFCAADKIVGRAAAFLFIIAGVRGVHAGVMSLGAKKLLEDHGVFASADTFCNMIINRKGDGPCPMESSVQGIDDPKEAIIAIRKTRETLTGGKSLMT